MVIFLGMKVVIVNCLLIDKILKKQVVFKGEQYGSNADEITNVAGWLFHPTNIQFKM